MRISDWNSDVCSSDLDTARLRTRAHGNRLQGSTNADAGANAGSLSYLPGQARSAQVRDPEPAHRGRNILSPSRRLPLDPGPRVPAPGSRIVTAFGGLSGKVGEGGDAEIGRAHV